MSSRHRNHSTYDERALATQGRHLRFRAFVNIACINVVQPPSNEDCWFMVCLPLFCFRSVNKLPYISSTYLIDTPSVPLSITKMAREHKLGRRRGIYMNLFPIASFLILSLILLLVGGGGCSTFCLERDRNHSSDVDE
jgi:hypothetical protein